MKYLFVPLRQRREHSHTRLRMVSPAQGLATARDFFISQTALDTCRKMCPPSTPSPPGKRASPRKDHFGRRVPPNPARYATESRRRPRSESAQGSTLPYARARARCGRCRAATAALTRSATSSRRPVCCARTAAGTHPPRRKSLRSAPPRAASPHILPRSTLSPFCGIGLVEKTAVPVQPEGFPRDRVRVRSAARNREVCGARAKRPFVRINFFAGVSMRIVAPFAFADSASFATTVEAPPLKRCQQWKDFSSGMIVRMPRIVTPLSTTQSMVAPDSAIS